MCLDDTYLFIGILYVGLSVQFDMLPYVMNGYCCYNIW